MTTPRTTIRRKLVKAMMLTSTAVLLLTGLVLIVYDVVSFRSSLVGRLHIRAEIIAANATASLAFENQEDASELLATLKSDPSTVAAALYDRQGRLFAAYPSASSDVPLEAMPPGHRFERSAVVLAQPVVEQDQNLGTLFMKSDLRALDERLRVYVLVVVLAVTGSIGVAFALSNWLQRGIARPVRALAETARSVSDAKDFSIRAHVVSDDELGMLTETFNVMLGELQQRDTERKRAEQEIRQLNADLERRVTARTAELQATNRELEAFSYSVSHDLRAPLRHIDGFADMLGRYAGPKLDEKGKHYLNTISAAAKSMGALIDDLLSFSRMARSDLRALPVNLEEIVGEVRRSLAAETEGRTIEWSIGRLPEVSGDPAMLRVVLTNLLANAVKYTRPCDQARIEVQASEVGAETVLVVRDNGVGFDPEYSHKLFGVFQRLHGSDEFEGTGIGLANVRRIIERHGGRVWAEGAVNAGAAFFVALPRIEMRPVMEEAA